MTEGGHDGAWYCAQRPQFDEAGLRNFCPDEGCPKGFCARDEGWNFGDPSPDRCTGIGSSPATPQPDIGGDPMKGPIEQYRGEPAIARLRQAYVIQQKEVRDQTALVWRCDLGFALHELTRLYAWQKSQKEEDEATPEPGQVDKLREALEQAEETLDQILDDMSGDGQCVCLAVKNEAIDTLAKVRAALTTPGDHPGAGGEA